MIDDINRNIIDRIVVERSKQFDSAIFGEIQQIAIENGIETRITMNEKAIADALKKQIPMKPIERIATSPVKIGNGIFGSGVKVHNCPNCNGLIAPVHKCCYHCGQKLDWNTNDNTCICCGEIIPEGRQVCPKCEKG